MTTRAMPLKQSETMKAAMATRPAPGFADLLRLEALKLVKRRMTRVVFAIMALLMTGIYALNYLFGHILGDNPDEPLTDMLMPDVLEGALDAIWVFGLILAVILAAGTAGSEFSWGTVRTVVSSGVPRIRLLLAKLAVLGAACGLLVLTGVAVVALAATVVALIEGYGLRLGWLDAASAYDVTLMILRSIFVVAVFAALAFSIAQFFRSVAAGIAIGLGFLIVSTILTELTSSLGGFGETLNDFFIITNVDVITALNTFDSPQLPPDSPGPWQAAAVMFLYAAIAIGLALWSFNRRDITLE